MSDSSIALKPVIDEPSKPIPSSSAASTSLGVIAKLFRCPSRSVNQKSTYATPCFSISFSTFFRASGSDVARCLLSIIAICLSPPELPTKKAPAADESASEAASPTKHRASLHDASPDPYTQIDAQAPSLVTLIRKSLGGVVATLLAIELLDELVFGAREAAWPLIRDDLSLSYTQIGLLLSVPNLVSLVIEPVLGVASVTWRRRALVVGGGLGFALALGLAAAAPSFWTLLVAFSLLYPASGAFVSLSQAALMDLEPDRREHNMARWTFAGGVGVVIGPLALAGFVLVGLGWRELFVGFAVAALALVLLLRRSPDSTDADERPTLREALSAIKRREVFRWLFLLELSDLLGDVLLGFLALYFVDAVGSSASTGGLAVAVWSGAGLVGAAAMIPLLRRVDGLRYLRASAVVTPSSSSGFCSHREPRPSSRSPPRSRSSTPAGTRCSRRASTPRWTGRAGSC